ncbi:hypothetical protein B0H11DRAFT_2429784 [Mycena galericulata]|nr:hypothetical protein B0H11DRAFT_2429784 [Mycena galericulata]
MPKKGRKRVAKEDRKNLRLWAEGARESVLTPHIEPYADALERNWRSERDYLKKICNEFNARISWRLGDHEEPNLPLPEFKPQEILVEEELTEEEEKQKRARLVVLRDRIRRWLKYRVRRLRKQVRGRLDARKDPWALLLAKLSGIRVPQKARQAYQQFMHEKFDTDIAPVVAEEWAATSVNKDGSLKTKKDADGPFRAKVARDLFAKLPESERQGYAARAKEEAAERRAEFEAAMKDPPSKSPEARQKCIDNVGSFMGPILEGIRERTGLHSVIIMGGPIPKYGGELRSVYVAYGRNRTSASEHFPQWGKQRFDSVLELMKEYLQTAFTAQEIDESRLPDGLEGAKYKMPPDADADSGSDSDSDSGSDSDDSDSSDSGAESSDSNRDSDDSDGAGARKGKRKGKKQEKKKEKRARKDAQKENVAKPTQGKGKRKGGKGAEPVLSYEELRLSIAQKAKSGAKKRAREDEPAPATRKSRRLNNSTRDTGSDEMPDTSPTPPAARAPQTPATTQPPPPPPPPPPPETPSATPPPTITVELPNDCPAWLSESIAWLTTEDLGCHYSSLLAALVKLETKYGFAEDNRGKLPAALRPAQVHSWIKGGRGKKMKGSPCINDVAAYAKVWNEWWDSLQPPWRTRDSSGHWSIGGSPGDNWDPLEAPGPNGCLSVAAALCFWGRSKSQSDELREQWDRAVQDVAWMLEGLEASIL